MKPDRVWRTPSHFVFVYPDDDAGSPRCESDVGVMVCRHRRYSLGDEQTTCDSLRELRESLEEDGALLIRPLYLFDHGGLSISMEDFGDRWDSGCVGFIYTTQAKMLEHYNGVDLGRALEDMRAEVRVYDMYLQNEVYEYVVKVRTPTLPGVADVDKAPDEPGFLTDWDAVPGEDSYGCYYGSDDRESGLLGDAVGDEAGVAEKFETVRE